jgi:hypothetical protein
MTLKGPSESGIYKVLKEFKDLLFVKFSLLISDYLIEIHCVLNLSVFGMGNLTNRVNGRERQRRRGMLKAEGRFSLVAKSIWKWVEGVFWTRRSQQAQELAPELWEPNGGEATGGNYSTVKSAQRLSATSSIIRPNERVQIIDS